MTSIEESRLFLNQINNLTHFQLKKLIQIHHKLNHWNTPSLSKIEKKIIFLLYFELFFL